jgi:hypothetical protein
MNDRWFFFNGVWSAELSELEYDYRMNRLAPVDPWGRWIKWGLWHENWVDGEFHGYDTTMTDPNTNQTVKLMVYND